MNSQPEKAVGLRRRMQVAVTQLIHGGISSAQADGFFWLRIHSPDKINPAKRTICFAPVA